MQLVINLPSEKVWVRKEYLRDHVDGHGEFVEGVWVSAKSIPGRAFYFETYLPEYGALYDKASDQCLRKSSRNTDSRPRFTEFAVLELYGLRCKSN